MSRSCIASPAYLIWIFLLGIISTISSGNNFTVYWNVPSERCQPFGIFINVSKYGIVQNTDDKFLGDKVTIFYAPGKFPYLNGDEWVNGGIPQKGNIVDHVLTFLSQIDAMVPDTFHGVAILDFESWLPGYREAKPEYQNASRSWIASLHPNWTHQEIEEEAERTFNISARIFMEVILRLGTQLRPNALWGYYHYPYCRNNGEDYCPPNMPEFNDKIQWLFNDSTVLYPSIYVFENSGYDPQGRRNMAIGRLQEALRVRNQSGRSTPILPYFWYLYHDTRGYLSSLDIVNTVGLSKIMNMDGAVVWGGYKDLNSTEQCLEFQNFVENSFGPLVQYVSRLPNAILRQTLNSRRLMKKIASTAILESKIEREKNNQNNPAMNMISSKTWGLWKALE